MAKQTSKDKILVTASALFAENGYDKTSIRDIATAADVNLASINYHFTNKLNLYKEVMNSNRAFLDQAIDSIAKEDITVEKFCIRLFDFYSNNSSIFLNSFKIFITNTLPISDEIIPEKCKSNFGPPGTLPMIRIISKQIGDDVSEEAIQWAARVLLSHVGHGALLGCSSFVKVMEDKVPFLNQSAKEHSIKCVVESILNFLKEHPDKFS